MTTSGIEWGAAFAMGLMGSTHCVAMCGPISAVLSSGTPQGPTGAAEDKRRLPIARPARASLPLRLATQAGRVTTYAGLGALFGAAGAGIRGAIALESVQLAARLAAALVLLGAGLYVAGLFRGFSRIEKLASPVLGPLRRFVGSSKAQGVGGHFMRGLGWGFLPCGLVLGALGLAIVVGTPHGGAATMVAFGIGTLPALLAVDVFALTLRRLLQHTWLKRAAGLLIVTSGVVQAVMAFEGARALGASPGEAAPRPCCAHKHHGS